MSLSQKTHSRVYRVDIVASNVPFYFWCLFIVQPTLQEHRDYDIYVNSFDQWGGVFGFFLDFNELITLS